MLFPLQAVGLTTYKEGRIADQSRLVKQSCPCCQTSNDLCTGALLSSIITAELKNLNCRDGYRRDPLNLGLILAILVAS
jgi:hypothetical protein